MESYFVMSAAAHEIRHPMSDLKLLEADLDEIAARAHTPVAAQPTAVFDHDSIWAKTNGKAQAALVTPKASTTSLDVDAIWRKYNHGGPNPDPLLVK